LDAENGPVGPFRNKTLSSTVHAETDSGVHASESRTSGNGMAGASSAEAMFAVDREQRIIAWNNEATRVFGQSSATAIGEHCYTVVAAADEAGRRFCRLKCAVMRAALKGPAPSPLQLRARVRGGDRVLIEVSTILLGADGAPGAVVHLCRPVAAPGETAQGDGATAPLAYRPPLTKRERQVLAALCRGETTDDMALAHGLSTTTVRNHVQRLMAKLAVHSRAEVVAMAYRDGLVR
jgi:PAS domain S-box-containing protein